MNTFFIVVTILSIIAVPIGIWGACWMRVILAVTLFTLLTFILLISFDGEARSIMGAAIEGKTLTHEYAEGIRALKHALLPYRLVLIFIGFGLMVLVIGRGKLGREAKSNNN